jgi:hypothetical protein
MKKSRIFTVGVLALALVLGLVLAGCGKSPSPSPTAGFVPASSPAQSVVAETPSPARSVVTETPAVTSSSTSVNWSKALDEYEKFVDEYVEFMKKYKANPTDMTLLTKSASMMESAQKAADAVQKVEDDLSGDDLAKFTERYAKLAAKMASVAF